jgi:hypothetical protein
LKRSRSRNITATEAPGRAGVEHALQVLVQQAAVGQAGQGVVGGEHLQAAFGLLAAGDVGHQAGHGGQAAVGAALHAAVEQHVQQVAIGMAQHRFHALHRGVGAVGVFEAVPGEDVEQQLEAGTRQCFARVAREAAQGRVDIEDAAVGAGQHIAGRGHLDHFAEALFALAQLALGLLAFAQVADDRLEEFLAAFLEARDVDLGRKGAAVLAPLDHAQQMGLALAQGLEQVGSVGEVAVDLAHGQAQQLLFGIAEVGAGAAVGGNDAQFAVGDQDAVAGLLEQVAEPLFALAHRLLGEPLFGDVVEVDGQAVRGRVGARLDPGAGRLPEGFDAGRPGVFHGLAVVLQQLGARQRGRDLEQRAAEAGLQRDADEAGRLDVGVDDAPVAVDGKEGVADAFQHGVHAFPGALQFLMRVAAYGQVFGKGNRGRRVHDEVRFGVA